nr:MAG TPA: hypothetical protein [Caudoviricetes sp.]
MSLIGERSHLIFPSPCSEFRALIEFYRQSVSRRSYNFTFKPLASSSRVSTRGMAPFLISCTVDGDNPVMMLT